MPFPSVRPRIAGTILVIGILAACAEEPTRPAVADVPAFAVTASPTYTITDLGSFGGGDGFATDINDQGLVLGRSATLDDGVGFVWANGVLTDIGSLGGGGTAPALRGLNGSGQVVGSSLTAAFDSHAFLWENGAMTDLGTGGGVSSSAQAVNDAGLVVGFVRFADGRSQAVLWRHGVLEALPSIGDQRSAGAGFVNQSGQIAGAGGFFQYPTPTGSYGHAAAWRNRTVTDLGVFDGGFASDARGINQAGDIIGTSTFPTGVPGQYYNHGVLWRNGTMIDLGVIPGSVDSDTRGINKHGEIIGYSTGHGFIWRKGVMTDLGSLGGGNTVPSGINDFGEVVGSSFTATHQLRGFRWKDGQMTELPTLTGTSMARVINNKGQIVGSSTNSDFERRPVIWNPN